MEMQLPMNESTETMGADGMIVEAPAADDAARQMREKALVTTAFIAYGLMAWGMTLFLQLAFLPYMVLLLALPAFIASGVVAHVKRNEARSFWMANHYRYLVRTFWFTLLWNVLTFSFQIPFFGFSTSVIGSIWGAYRVVRGMSLLQQRKAVPDYSA